MADLAKDRLALADTKERTGIIAELGAQSQQEPKGEDFGPWDLPALKENTEKVGRLRQHELLDTLESDPEKQETSVLRRT